MNKKKPPKLGFAYKARSI